MTISVTKINIQSLNKLLDLGYTVTITQQATTPAPYARYAYSKPLKPMARVLGSSVRVDMPRCDVCYRTKCPHMGEK